MAEDAGEFWVDVGGTFTDCIWRLPGGALRTHKLLSTGCYPASLSHDPGSAFHPQNAFLRQAPAGYFVGYRFRCRLSGEEFTDHVVTEFDAAGQLLTLDPPLPAGRRHHIQGEFFSHEEAPVAGIRWLLGLRLDQPVGPVRVRLGTTRATNALLERRGARTALVATAGFADALRIGYQDRPALFDLRIDQPPELYEAAVEVTERLRADGSILLPLDERAARDHLASLRAQTGIESLAVCLLHAYRNPGPRATHRARSPLGARLPARLALASGQHAAEAHLPGRHDGARRLPHAGPAGLLPSTRRATAGGGPAFHDQRREPREVGGVQWQGRDPQRARRRRGGTARVTDRAGLAPAFAFDMGGTSTDVSRWDGAAFTRRYEADAGAPAACAGCVCNRAP